MSIRTHGQSKKCPHCNEWLVTPEQAKQQKKHMRRFLLVWTIACMCIIFGSIYIINIFSEDPTQDLEQMALGKIVDIDYWSDGAYEVYLSNLYVDGVPQDIERYVFSFSDSITAVPTIDQTCIFWGPPADSSIPNHQVQYIEYV